MDLKLIETGNGGDVVKNAKDLAVIFGFQNVPYLSMFGGNVEESTPTTRNYTQQAFDWWGNDLLMPNDSLIQFNSETERALNTFPLTSSGRLKIENAVKKDLEGMQTFAKVDVQTSITSDDRIEIAIRLTKLSNLKSVQFVYLWDATMRELSVIPDSPGNPIPLEAGIFDTSFDFSFE